MGIQGSAAGQGRLLPWLVSACLVPDYPQDTEPLLSDR